MRKGVTMQIRVINKKEGIVREAYYNIEYVFFNDPDYILEQLLECSCDPSGDIRKKECDCREKWEESIEIYIREEGAEWIEIGDWDDFRARLQLSELPPQEYII
jgi:hypothetical protein